MAIPDVMLFLQGIGKMVYEPFRVTSRDVKLMPNLRLVAIFLWTMTVGYFRNELSAIGLEYINAGILIITLLCITWTEYLITSVRIDRLLDRKFIQDLINAMIYLSFPVVLVFYVWYPLYDRMPCIIKRFTKDAAAVEEWRATTWIILSCFIFLSAVYGVCRGLNKSTRYRRSSVRKNPNAHTPVTRSMTKKYKYY